MNITITIPGLLELATALQNQATAAESMAMAIFAQANAMPKLTGVPANWADHPINPAGENVVISDEAPTPEKESLAATEVTAKRARRTKAEIAAAKAPAADDIGAQNIAAINAKLDAMRAAPAAPAEAPEKTDHELREDVRSIYRERSANDPDFKNTYAEKLASVNDGEVVRLDILPRDKVIALISALS